MQKFYVAYDIFGHGQYCWDDFFIEHAVDRGAVEIRANQIACDEWCSYGGLHGIGYGEEEIEERLEEGLTREEIIEEEWQEAENSVDYVVYNEDEFFKFLKNDGYTDSEIEKIVLDLESKT